MFCIIIPQLTVCIESLLSVSRVDISTVGFEKELIRDLKSKSKAFVPSLQKKTQLF